jgi:hypothetical protein
VPLIAGVLTAVLGDFSARHQLAPNLVANAQDVKLLVRARLQGDSLPAQSLLTQGWRNDHVLPHLLAVLDGRRSLQISDVASEAPFTLKEIGN